MDSYLNTLGPLETPHKGSRAGVDVADPRTALAEDTIAKGETHMMPVFKGRTGTH